MTGTAERATPIGPPPEDVIPAIEIDRVTKVYSTGTRAVEDVSLTVPPGQVLGFLGPNGAGKPVTRL